MLSEIWLLRGWDMSAGFFCGMALLLGFFTVVFIWSIYSYQKHQAKDRSTDKG
jgi:hypothetical protein